MKNTSLKYVTDILERQKSFLDTARNTTNKKDVDKYLEQINTALNLIDLDGRCICGDEVPCIIICKECHKKINLD